MNVCSNCFNELELQAFINTSLVNDNCDACNSREVKTLDINELLDFLSELFSNFELQASGTPLIELIQGNWSFFRTIEIGQTILNEALHRTGGAIYASDQNVKFSKEIQENVDYWDTLKEELKWSKRFVTNIDLLTQDLGWDKFFHDSFLLPHTDTLFRARLHHHADSDYFPIDKMTCPPKELVDSGRANSAGIPYLYLSRSPDTPLCELRAALLDELSVGEFKLKEDEAEIKIVDFTSPTPLYRVESAIKSSVAERIKAHLLKKKISADLSRPMRIYDSPVEYIPTQFICEFINVFTGAEGIQFRSSVHRTGKNLVIFNEKKIVCTNVTVRKISAIDLISVMR